MNIVDFVILGVLGISVLFGLYKGFINSILGLVGVFAALVIAYSAYPQLAKTLQADDSLIRTLAHYSDAASRVGDLDLARTPVANISPQVLNDIMSRAALPEPFDSFVRENIAKLAFSSTGGGTVSDYLNQTIIAVSLNILCFLLCFAVAYAVITLLAHLLHYVFRMPVLKHFDLLLGAVFGGIRGVFLVFVLFALVPILITVSPITEVAELVEQSRFAGVFAQNSLIQSIMQGTLF